MRVSMNGVVACRVIPGPEGGWRREVSSFGTTTGDLLQLADWLKEEQVTHVAIITRPSGRAILGALLEGQTDSVLLASWPRGA